MSLQNPYTKSIKPKSIVELRDLSKFNDFIDYFKRDCNNFIMSCSNYDDLVLRFSKIKNELNLKNMLNEFLIRIQFHSRLVNYKLNPVQEYLNLLWNNYNLKINEIYELCQDNIRINISLPPTQEAIDLLEMEEKEIVQQALQELEITYINFIVIIGGLINLVFFVFETECKILCSLGCFAFSIIYARNDIIQHNDVWKTLKKLSQNDPRESINCEICQMRRECDFSIDFEALANIYCYAIKIRMLADYDELFYKNQMWELIKEYLDNIEYVIINQENIKKSI